MIPKNREKKINTLFIPEYVELGQLFVIKHGYVGGEILVMAKHILAERLPFIFSKKEIDKIYKSGKNQ